MYHLFMSVCDKYLHHSSHRSVCGLVRCHIRWLSLRGQPLEFYSKFLTLDNLIKRKGVVGNRCITCKYSCKIVDHLLFHRPIA